MTNLVRYILAAIFVCLAADLFYQATYAGQDLVFAFQNTNYLNYAAAVLLVIDAIGLMLKNPWMLWLWVATMALYTYVALTQFLIPMSAHAIKIYPHNPHLTITFFSYWIVPFIVGIAILVCVPRLINSKNKR